MRRGSGIGAAWRLLALCLAMLVGTAAHAACAVTPGVNGDLGSFSPNALKAGAPPYVAVAGGFGCSTVPLATLLNGNYLKATVASGSVLTLTSTTSSDTIAYTLAAAAGGSPALNPGTATFYINGTVLNVLGLFGTNTASLPIYVKPSAGTTIAPGTYKGTVVIKWEWYFCSLIGALNLCVGTLDQGSQSATVNLTMEVAARPATIALSSITTWDPVSTTNNPKTIPASRRRTALTVTNDDIVALDLDTLRLALRTAAGTSIALDGDGTGSAFVQTVQGTPASGLTVAYGSPAATGDDVEFSADGGASWSYVPVAGDLASQGAVTHLRFSPKGSMAARSSLSISVPYLVH